MEHNRLCIIPARGGSKRMPRKNIRKFLGKPIIEYSIKAALESGVFEEVMVSTDDSEIAEVSAKAGANVPFLRSKENADDFATTTDVLLEVLGQYAKLNRSFDSLCCIYATSPLINSEMISNGYFKLVQEDYSSVFPVVKFGYPIWRGLYREQDGSIKMVWKENERRRSQDLPDVYHDAGQWYWTKTKDFLVNKTLFSDRAFGLEVSEERVQDIDNEMDWKLAELKYENIYRSR